MKKIMKCRFITGDGIQYSPEELEEMFRSSQEEEIKLPTGEAGIGRNGEEYWYFEDEEDLRRLLVEKIIPFLQTTAMKDFDEQLENELEHLEKYPKARQYIND